MSKVHDDALARLVVGEDLSRCFVHADNLGIYRQWMKEQQQYVEHEDICQKITKFGKTLAGPQDELLGPLVKLILRLGLQSWGSKIDSPKDIVEGETTYFLSIGSKEIFWI
jgi:hypothetical protein